MWWTDASTVFVNSLHAVSIHVAVCQLRGGLSHAIDALRPLRGYGTGGRRAGAPLIPGFPTSCLGPQTNVCSKNACLALSAVLGHTPHDETPHWGDPEQGEGPLRAARRVAASGGQTAPETAPRRGDNKTFMGHNRNVTETEPNKNMNETELKQVCKIPKDFASWLRNVSAARARPGGEGPPGRRASGGPQHNLPL